MPAELKVQRFTKQQENYNSRRSRLLYQKNNESFWKNV